MDYTPTPSQTVGPFFMIGFAGPLLISHIAAPGVPGERVKLVCTVFAGENQPVNDALIEIWQANAEGKYNHSGDPQEKPVDPSFLGFGRQGTDDLGVCVFHTIKPGRVPANDGSLQAPHPVVGVFTRGVLQRLPTRIYFAGDPANDSDPVLALVPAARRVTLLAQPVPGEPETWRFDVHLTGARETVFFDI